MKALYFKALLKIFSISIFSSFIFIGAADKDAPQRDNSLIIRSQVSLEANNVRSFIWNTGVFNQDMRTENTPGFEWPKGSGKFAIFTTGLSLGAYVNSQLRLATASYSGEYVPGYCVNGVLQTNSAFKQYKVTAGDNQFSNPDWANWGLMVPYGAPYKDVNLNGTYEPATDIPGVIGATQTVFICLTDADPTAHTPSEGFGGGTAPLGAEVHLTAWCYNVEPYEDMQFLKWVVINRNTSAWDSTLISIVADPDLGDAGDDYIGCDTTNNLGFCYNADNNDGSGSGNSYGQNPPAVGIAFLNCSGSNAKLTSFSFFTNTGNPGPSCETDPSDAVEAYNYMSGFKKDRTPWINVHTMLPTKFCYAHSGWTEYHGKINNCSGELGGPVEFSIPGDRRFVMNYKPANQTLNPGDSQVVAAVQLITRGTSNLNSLELVVANVIAAKNLCQNGFVIGINPISSEIPVKFELSQNYPNPFNPVTKIIFNIPLSRGVSEGRGVLTKLTIYDALGREVATLVNENLNPGIYSVDWNAANYPSGIYFYKLTSGNYSDSKKMVLIK